MNPIYITTVNHKAHRYETVGDYYRDTHGNLIIKVSDIGDPRIESLVAVHELIEALICEHNGIAEKDITAFDVAFEKARKPGNVDEPGDDPRAPYKRPHCIATAVERLLAAELGVDWKAYESACNDLSLTPTENVPASRRFNAGAGEEQV